MNFTNWLIIIMVVAALAALANYLAPTDRDHDPK